MMLRKLILFCLISISASAAELSRDEYETQLRNSDFSRQEIEMPELYKLWKTVRVLEDLLRQKNQYHARTLDSQIEQVTQRYFQIEQYFFHSGLGPTLAKLHMILPDLVSEALLIRINIELGIPPEDLPSLDQKSLERIHEAIINDTGSFDRFAKKERHLRLIVDNSCYHLFPSGD